MSFTAPTLSRRLTSLVATAAVALFAAACEESTGPDDSLANIAVNPATPTLNVGGTQQLKATGTSSSGHIVTTPDLVWTSSAQAVATVNANGVVTAVAGGTATITATSGDVSNTATITVLFPVTNVTLAAAGGASTTIPQEGSVTIVPTFTANGQTVTGRQVVWASSNPAVATVNSSGFVSALGIDGTTNITATTLIGGVVGTLPVTVSGPPVVATVTLAVTSNAMIGMGQTEQLVATARAASGTVLSLAGRTVSWSSGTPATATVDGNGLVSMLATSGTSPIRVTVDGVQSAALTVTGATVLTNATPLAVGAMAVNTTRNFVIDVPAGTTNLTATTAGGSGDADLEVFAPNAATRAGASEGATTAESVSITNPAAGRWRVRVIAFTDVGAGMNLTATRTP